MFEELREMIDRDDPSACGPMSKAAAAEDEDDGLHDRPDEMPAGAALRSCREPSVEALTGLLQRVARQDEAAFGELYDATVVRFTMGISNLFWKIVDTKIVDGIVNGVGYTLEGASAVLRWAQTGFVGTYALLFVAGVVALLLHFLMRN